MPLVSICCLSYNHEKFIKEAIESFWSQNYKNIEIIALDDGSTDNSYNILQELANKSPCPMTALTQPNTHNIPLNLNRLLSKAKGKYIAIISLDDKLTPYSISKKLECMEKDDNIAFVIDSKLQVIDANSNPISTIVLCTDNHETMTCDELLENEYECKWTFYTQGSLFRKYILDYIGHLDENMISDDDVLRLKLFYYLKDNKNLYCKIFQDASCYYRRHGSNISNNLYNNCLMIAQVQDKFFPNRKRPKGFKDRIKSTIPRISYSQFKKLNYFKYENKSKMYEFVFFIKKKYFSKQKSKAKERV